MLLYLLAFLFEKYTNGISNILACEEKSISQMCLSNRLTNRQISGLGEKRWKKSIENKSSKCTQKLGSLTLLRSICYGVLLIKSGGNK